MPYNLFVHKHLEGLFPSNSHGVAVQSNVLRQPGLLHMFLRFRIPQAKVRQHPISKPVLTCGRSSSRLRCRHAASCRTRIFSFTMPEPTWNAFDHPTTLSIRLNHKYNRKFR